MSLSRTLKKLLTLRPRLKAKHLAEMNPQAVFNTIYQTNAWNGGESVSGQGSDLDQTAEVARQLPVILKELGATSMLDLPCGDFYWMRHVDLGDVRYIGGDIVESLVRSNQAYASKNRSFVHCNLMEDDLPQVDVIFCRDCLVHFSNHHVAVAIENIKRSPAKYLVTTTFTHRGNERDIQTGQWRPLNLQSAPFGLPEPDHWIDEKCTQDGGQYPDKMMAVWSIERLRDHRMSVNRAA